MQAKSANPFVTEAGSWSTSAFDQVRATDQRLAALVCAAMGGQWAILIIAVRINTEEDRAAVG